MGATDCNGDDRPSKPPRPPGPPPQHRLSAVPHNNSISQRASRPSSQAPAGHNTPNTDVAHTVDDENKPPSNAQRTLDQSALPAMRPSLFSRLTGRTATAPAQALAGESLASNSQIAEQVAEHSDVDDVLLLQEESAPPREKHTMALANIRMSFKREAEPLHRSGIVIPRAAPIPNKLPQALRSRPRRRAITSDTESGNEDDNASHSSDSDYDIGRKAAVSPPADHDKSQKSCRSFFQPVVRESKPLIPASSSDEGASKVSRMRKSLKVKRSVPAAFADDEDGEDRLSPLLPLEPASGKQRDIFTSFRLKAEQTALADLLPSKPAIPFCGLRNMGNTCFMNSILQSLRSCVPFSHGLLSLYQTRASKTAAFIPAQNRVTRELCKLFEDMNVMEQRVRAHDLTTDCVIRPQALVDALAVLNPMYARRVQQDAQEFLKFLLNVLHEDEMLHDCGDDPMCTAATISDTSASSAVATTAQRVESTATTLPALEPAAPSLDEVALVSRPSLLDTSVEVTTNTSFVAMPSDADQKATTLDPSKVDMDIRSHEESTPVKRRAADTPPALEAKRPKLISSFFTPQKTRPLVTEHDVKPRQALDPLPAACADSNPTLSSPEPVALCLPSVPPVSTDSPIIIEDTPKRLITSTSLADEAPVTASRVTKKLVFDDIYSSECELPSRASHSSASSCAPAATVSIPKELPPVTIAPQHSQPTASSCAAPVVPAKSLIQRTFEGQLRYSTRCRECENVTERVESFMDLTLPVSQSDAKALSAILDEVAGAEEVLNGANKYSCEVCRVQTEAQRSVKIDALPPVLIMHLNRSTGERSNKITTAVPAPLTLKLADWCTATCVGASDAYRLQAVVFHTGASSSVGHYTADVCPADDPSAATSDIASGQWIHTNDVDMDFLSCVDVSNKCTPLSPTSATAYMLFYVRSSDAGVVP